MNRYIGYFISGLLFVVPLAVSLWTVYLLYTFIDGLIPIPIPGIGFLLVILIITTIGFFFKKFSIASSVLGIETIIKKVPLLNLVYSSVQDLMSSLVGSKKKFDKPVLVRMNNNLFKPGFVTANDLGKNGLSGVSTVYFPHSYNFSGNIFLVDRKYIKPIKSSTADVMKYIVSGGVSGAIKV
tara:strand:- start:360 stop:905 length:546 start_codon:yes stop_codon:yes gene_type:complete